jgi:hypothetical protein
LGQRWVLLLLLLFCCRKQQLGSELTRFFFLKKNIRIIVELAMSRRRGERQEK